jgi:hypothetical protein
MATILEFRRAAEAAPRIMQREDCPIGQIIIFPGVRIERGAFEEAPSGPANHSGKRAQRARKKQR